MIPSLSQEELTQYASDAQTIQQPQGVDYTQGVKAGRTIPAKWWNWLFSASTKRIVQARSDADNMLTELKNVVTDAGLTPTASDNTQLKQAVEAKAAIQIDSFVENKQAFYSLWEVIETRGLLPQNTGSNGTYRLDYAGKVNGVHFALNRTYRTASGSHVDAQNALAFSTDLRNWHLLRGSDFAKSAIDTTPQFSAGVTFFKGYWYVLMEGTYNSSGTSLYWVLVKLSSLENPTDYTEVGSGSTVLGSYMGFQIGTLGTEVLYVQTGSTSSVRITTDGSTFSSISLPYISQSIFGTTNGWCAYEGYRLGSSYVVGDFIADAAGENWRCYNTLRSSQSISAYIIGAFNGGILIGSGGVYFLANETANAILLGGANYTFLQFTSGHRHAILSLNDLYYVAYDISTITALDTRINYGVTSRIDSLRGVYYAVFSSDNQIYSSADLQNWSPTGKYLPVDTSTLSVVSEANVFVAGTKCSKDLGTTWTQSKDSTGQDYCPTKITTIEDDKLFVTINYVYTPVNMLKLIYTTTYGVNIVVGHTLYLR